MIYRDFRSEGMQGPFPASEIAGPAVSGAPSLTDRRRNWELGRQWGGYPELEWTFGVFAERRLALSGEITAYFYEMLNDFDTARRLMRYAAHLMSRREKGTPSLGIGFQYFDGMYRVPDGRLRLPCASEPFRGRHLVSAFDHDDLETIKFANSWGADWVSAGTVTSIATTLRLTWITCQSGGPPSAALRRAWSTVFAAIRPGGG